MRRHEKSLLPTIEANYQNLTESEKIVADFFLHHPYEEKRDYSQAAICKELTLSPSCLSRFSKKLGFRGYREFIFEYQKYAGEEAKDTKSTDQVFETYEEILSKTYSLINPEQISGLVDDLIHYKRIYVYGFGSSGLAAQEFKNRFIRVGLDVEAVTDTHALLINGFRLNEYALVIGISYSGATREVIEALIQAAGKGAKTVLITSRNEMHFHQRFSEVILCAVKKNLEYGDIISPQLPVLILIDRIYAEYINREKKRKMIYDASVETFVDRYINYQTGDKKQE
ncbi:MAG: MurR/RpiR family transcriptional regulator [Oribacterium sp.]|nr:MurR/RpiR family transcriptional regulator [Oribacterium sp.]